ncbi:hypothetical protein [Microbacterium protaetiae]|uniref:hypothetical protein n=1 Tax=Microbacterium protaetiae TaxID=2509458 RepID=UPI0013EBD762|nr:hypothetical protein [Microbacterium protaetiae]
MSPSVVSNEHKLIRPETGSRVDADAAGVEADGAVDAAAAGEADVEVEATA